MKEKYITKNIRQYSRPLDEETMDFLRGIALDYARVKERVYQRYSGIRHIGHLTPVYDILTEMRRSGLRQDLNLPVVYFELAIADAVSDIKTMWAVLKDNLREKVRDRENLTDDERHYLYTALKYPSFFEAILNEREFPMPEQVKDLDADAARMNNMLRRLVRKYRRTPVVRRTDTFRCTPAGFRYRDGGIAVVSRIPRKRVYIPLKDDNTTDRQIAVTVRENDIVIAINLDVPVRVHMDYTNTVYAHIGYKDALTLSNGHVYGESLNALVTPETYWLDHKNRSKADYRDQYKASVQCGDMQKAGRIEKNNLGREKYDEHKARERRKTEQFINAAINRMMKEEKPQVIVITKRVKRNRTKYGYRNLNRKLSRRFEGFIRQRLEFKCRENGIELVEISSKGTGSVCSLCGAGGKAVKEGFRCENCKAVIPIGLNGARNIERKAKDIEHNGNETERKAKDIEHNGNETGRKAKEKTG